MDAGIVTEGRNVCHPKADLGFDAKPRPSHCWHPLSGMGVPFALRDGTPTAQEFCCRCHAVQASHEEGAR